MIETAIVPIKRDFVPINLQSISLLMHKIIQQTKDEGYNTISLSVDLENDTAINMYQKLGFKDYEVVGTTKTMINKF